MPALVVTLVLAFTTAAQAAMSWAVLEDYLASLHKARAPSQASWPTSARARQHSWPPAPVATPASSAAED